MHSAILYGVDARATSQIVAIERKLISDAIHDRPGSRLSSQAVGPKLARVAENEPEVWSWTQPNGSSCRRRGLYTA